MRGPADRWERIINECSGLIPTRTPEYLVKPSTFKAEEPGEKPRKEAILPIKVVVESNFPAIRLEPTTSVLKDHVINSIILTTNFTRIICYDQITKWENDVKYFNYIKDENKLQKSFHEWTIMKEQFFYFSWLNFPNLDSFPVAVNFFLPFNPSIC